MLRYAIAVAIPRQSFDVIFYGFVGLFKGLFLVFNVVPWVALLIIR
jgi:hypothetical protein